MNNKKIITFWGILDIALILISSISFFFFFSDLFTNIVVNKGVNFVYNIPFYFVTMLAFIFPTLIILSHYYKKTEKFYSRLGLIQTGVSIISIVILAIFLANKFDGDLFRDGPIRAYPLISLIISSIYFICGLLLFFQGNRINKYVVPPTEKHPIVDSILLTLILLVTYFYLGDFIIRWTCFDTSKNIIGMGAVVLMLLIPFIEVILYLFFYKTKPFELRSKYRIIYSLIVIALSVILFLISVIYELIHPDFVVESGQALFPASFAGSIPATFIIMILLGIVLPLIIIIIELISKKLKKE